VQAVRHLRTCDPGERRIEIDELQLRADVARRDSRDADDQGHVHEFVIQPRVVLEHAVFHERLAVVGGHHDDRLIPESTAPELFKESANRRICCSNLAVVASFVQIQVA
jgi:hypothetical protein